MKITFEPTGTKQTNYGHFADILKKSNDLFAKNPLFIDMREDFCRFHP
jgi:hypothetical protein